MKVFVFGSIVSRWFKEKRGTFIEKSKKKSANNYFNFKKNVLICVYMLRKMCFYLEIKRKETWNEMQLSFWLNGKTV